MHTAGLKPLPKSTKTLAQVYAEWPRPLAPATDHDARSAGNPNLESTDMISAGDGEFRPNQGPAGIRNDARSVILKTADLHGGLSGLVTEPYAPSGRR